MPEIPGGGYIGFVDSDDWLPKRSVELLEKRIDETKADVVFGNYSTVLVSGKHKRNTFTDAVISVDNKEELENFMPGVFPPWGSLFSKELLTELRFPLNMKLNDDSFFVYQCLQNCKTIATLSESIYYYNHINDVSITRTACSDHNVCFARSLSERKKLFPGQSLPQREQRVILEIFFVSLMHYVLGFSEADAVEKLGETYEIFKPFLELVVDDQIKEFDDMYTRFYLKNKQFMEVGDYSKVYGQLLEIAAKQNQKRRFKAIVRKMLLKPEQFVVFRLGLFYK